MPKARPQTFNNRSICRRELRCIELGHRNPRESGTGRRASENRTQEEPDDEARVGVIEPDRLQQSLDPHAKPRFLKDFPHHALLGRLLRVNPTTGELEQATQRFMGGTAPHENPSVPKNNSYSHAFHNRRQWLRAERTKKGPSRIQYRDSPSAEMATSAWRHHRGKDQSSRQSSTGSSPTCSLISSQRFSISMSWRRWL